MPTIDFWRSLTYSRNSYVIIETYVTHLKYINNLHKIYLHFIPCDVQLPSLHELELYQ